MPNDRIRYPSRSSPIISVAETCGIEFEVDTLTNSDFRQWEGMNKFQLTHDASCESPGKTIQHLGIRIENDDGFVGRILPIGNVTIGTELVSSILDSTDDNFLALIKSLTEFLVSKGEPPTSLRSGIHFHFSLPSPNLRILKSIIRLGRYLESVFFTIGGMGYEFRGVHNDSVYCRPITKWGPPCVPRYEGWSQVFDVKELLKSKKLVEFWHKYGELENHGGRYNPVRYTWLNLYPLSPYGEHRGTLEFRLFNKSLNPIFIYAIAIFCKKFTEYAIESSFGTLKDDGFLVEHSIFDDDITKHNLSKYLIKFSELSGMDDDILRTLLDILDRSPIPKLNSGYMRTHLTRDIKTYWKDTEYNPLRIPSSQTRKPVYVDLHLLTGRRSN